MQADFDLRPISVNDLAARRTELLDPAVIDVLLLVLRATCRRPRNTRSTSS